MKKTSVLIALIFVMATMFSYAEFVKIKGIVIDSIGEPVVGAIIGAKDSKVFAYSDKKGRFAFYIKVGDSLVVRKFGFEPKNIFIKKNELNFAVKLDKSSKQDENQFTQNNPLSPAFDGEYSIDMVASEASIDYDGTSMSKGGMMSPKSMSFSRVSSEVSSEGHTRGGMGFADVDDSGIAPPIEQNIDASSGRLTAGEINDFSKWKLWNDMAYEVLKEHSSRWKIYPLNRFVLQLQNQNGVPVIGASAKLISNNKIVWATITDNTGKAELWSNAFDNQNFNENFSIEFNYSGKNYTISKAKQFHQGINYYKIDADCYIPNSADIVFVVDATGSMQDEIDFLRADLLDIINSVKDTLPQLDLNLGCVFYKDTTDEYVAKYYDLVSRPEYIIDFIKEHRAGGGGDFPEAVDRALDVAVNYLSWREKTITKIVFLVLDAPPHESQQKIAELQNSIAKAAELGIRIVPVACSGVDKSTEYIMRSIALLTNGSYTFLTDHSGIGNAHIEPTTDKYKVEKLNDILKRVILQYTNTPLCSGMIVAGKADTGFVDVVEINPNVEDSDLQNYKFYPNPTQRFLTIELKGQPENIYIADVSGKTVMQIQVDSRKKIEVDLAELPSGTYLVMYEYQTDKWTRGKFILNK